MSCIECGSTKNLQVHHDSYDPPKIRRVCTSCHFKIHKHCVGRPIGFNKNKKTEYVVLSIRNTKRFSKIINKFLILNNYTSKTNFVRDVIRDKIREEAPQLYLEMFEEEEK